MVNWCYSTLRITGDSEEINRLPWKDTNLRDLKLFEPLLPYPDGLNHQEHFEWLVENWGVKGCRCVEIVDFDHEYIELQFDTPWNAPHKGIGKIAAMFPSLRFHLQSAESGSDWQGSFTWNNGSLIQQINGTYYAQSASTCPKCHSDYFPAIDIQGEIGDRECFECGWFSWSI